MARCAVVFALLAAAHGFAPASHATLPKGHAAPRSSRSVAKMQAADTMIPDMNKRVTMNALLLLGGVGPVVAVDGWLKDHGAGAKALVQGLKGDATYLLV